MLTGNMPFENIGDILTGQPKPLDKRINKTLRKMALLMITKDLDKRPNAEALISILDEEYEEITENEFNVFISKEARTV